MTRDERAQKIRLELGKLANSRNTFSLNDFRVILGLERIVARFSADKVLSKHLVYKGGFVLMKVLSSERFTRDLDALGVGVEKYLVRVLVPKALEVDIVDGSATFKRRSWMNKANMVLFASMLPFRSELLRQEK